MLAARRRPALPLALTALGAGAGATALGMLGGGWYFANQLLDPRRAGDPYDLAVVAVDQASVTLADCVASRLPGAATLQWPGGYGLLGAIPEPGPSGVRRALTHRVGAALSPRSRCRLKRHAVEGDPQVAFGLEFEEITLAGPLGPLPAWLVPGSPEGALAGAFAVVVHGRGSIRPAMLRVLPDLHTLGLSCLVVTYRNDTGAPASPDGHYHLGDSEWQDLEPALREATLRGASAIALVADSMGAAACLQLLRRSARGADVAALVLDAPVLDWQAVLALAARQRHVPGPLVATAKAIVRRRARLDWARLDQLRQADSLNVPMLLIHGDCDTTVPVAPSQALARRRPDLVSFLAIPGADHGETWLLNRPACSAALRSFLPNALGGAAAPVTH